MTRIIPTGVLIAVFLAQFGFGYWARPMKPYWEILPDPPTAPALAFWSFGDEQYLFRVLAMRVQNAGDFGGRVVPVRAYDQGQAAAWLEVLAGLDPVSEYPVGLAYGFFGQSQDPARIGPMIAFIRGVAARDPSRRWLWMFRAISLARYRMKDPALALDIARQLAAFEVPGLPIWTGLAPAFILEDTDDVVGALDVVSRTRSRAEFAATDQDRQWIDQYEAYLRAREKGLAPRRRSWLDELRE